MLRLSTLRREAEKEHCEQGGSAGRHVPCPETEPVGMGAGARWGGQLCSSGEAAAFNALFRGGCLNWGQVECVMPSDS